MNTYKAINGRVIIKPEPVENTTKGGLYIPESTLSNTKPQRGLVVSLSRGDYEFKEGDTVWFGNYSQHEVMINDEKHLILNATDVWMVV